jgi:hypothetical protein
MYIEEGIKNEHTEICSSILKNNIFGLDIDERAIQISEAVLWMKAAEKVVTFYGVPENLVSTNVVLPSNNDHINDFIKKYPKTRNIKEVLDTLFNSLENINILGSLLKIEEPINSALSSLRKEYGSQTMLFGPKTEIEWNKYKEQIIEDLKSYFIKEASSLGNEEYFLGSSGKKGIKIFELLSNKYDVVSTNPPFMGSGNMNSILKNYILKNYNSVKRDLYGAFIIRSLELLEKYGYVALVTQQSWMFAKSFSKFRMNKNGLLKNYKINYIAHLGAGAFSEISGEVVNTALLITQNVEPNSSDNIVCYRLNELDYNLKKTILKENNKEYRYIIPQNLFLKIPKSPIMYWIPLDIIQLFENIDLSNRFNVRQGIVTGKNDRFIRTYYEVPENNRWKSYVKGGGYCKWTGLRYYLLEYENNALRLDLYHEYCGINWPRPTYREEYKKGGFTYTLMSSGYFGLRILKEGELSDSASPYIYPKKHIEESQYYNIFSLNCRFFSYLLRAITNDIKFRESYVGRVPIINNLFNKDNISFNIQFKKYVELALYYKGELNKLDIKERDYNPDSSFKINNYIKIACNLHLVEGELERLVFQNLPLNKETLNKIYEETGVPVSWYPNINNYEKYSFEHNSLLINEIPKNNIDVDQKELEKIKLFLKKMFEEDIYNENDMDYLKKINYPKIKNNPPPETLIEKYSLYLRINPINVYNLLIEGINEKGWVNINYEKEILLKKITTIINKIFGYNWYRNTIENNDKINEYMIIEGNNTKNIILEIKRLLNKKNISFDKFNKKFLEFYNVSLKEFLLYYFFREHSKQFSKRPILWHISSKPEKLQGRSKKKPAFSCILHYRKMNENTLSKILNQQVVPLKNSYKIEYETIKNSTLNDKQTIRLIELEGLISELSDLEHSLNLIISKGFFYKGLNKLLREEPLDKWASTDGSKSHPLSYNEYVLQEQKYSPDLNDGIRVNIAPLQKNGVLAYDILSKKDLVNAIKERSEWRRDERNWCRIGKLSSPGWWKIEGEV